MTDDGPDRSGVTVTVELSYYEAMSIKSALWGRGKIFAKRVRHNAHNRDESVVALRNRRSLETLIVALKKIEAAINEAEKGMDHGSAKDENASGDDPRQD